MVNGISCARYWSLILKFAYEKEGIDVPDDVQKAEFALYPHPKTMEDNLDVFPSIAQIPDAMLRKVDPANTVLVAYLQTINPSIGTGVLLAKGDKVKRGKPLKKDTKASPSKPVTESTPKKVSKAHVSKSDPVPIPKEVVQPKPSQT